MDKKKSFIVFAPEFLALSNHLNLKQRGELMTALCEMVLYGEPMKPISQEISKAYDFMAESIKDNFSKYDAVCEKRRAIATKAASKRRANAEQKQAEKSANAKLNEDEDDNENKNEDDLNKKIKKEIKEKTNKKESSYLANVPSLDDFQLLRVYEGTSHSVIGQEFDNVIVIIDNFFCYDGAKQLKSIGRPGNPYDQVKMLFQAMTRVKRKLEIVVINNQPVFGEILKLLS